MSLDLHGEVAEKYPTGPECSKEARDYWYTEGFNHALLVADRRQKRVNDLEATVEALSAALEDARRQAAQARDEER